MFGFRGLKFNPHTQLFSRFVGLGFLISQNLKYPQNVLTTLNRKNRLTKVYFTAIELLTLIEEN